MSDANLIERLKQDALKPANLLINAQEELKIHDFVLAQTVPHKVPGAVSSKGIYSGLGF